MEGMPLVYRLEIWGLNNSKIVVGEDKGINGARKKAVSIMKKEHVGTVEIFEGNNKVGIVYQNIGVYTYMPRVWRGKNTNWNTELAIKKDGSVTKYV